MLFDNFLKFIQAGLNAMESKYAQMVFTRVSLVLICQIEH